jgi:hypothetical protein
MIGHTAHRLHHICGQQSLEWMCCAGCGHAGPLVSSPDTVQFIARNLKAVAAHGTGTVLSDQLRILFF